MSTAIAFDTLKFARRLKDAGIPENQAEAISGAFSEAQATHLDALATKGDIREIVLNMATKEDIVRLDKQLLSIKWMLALVIAVTVLPTLRILFSI